MRMVAAYVNAGGGRLEVRNPGGRLIIRDMNDYPVLYTAITENVDILVTGDKDFADIAIEKPEILTPSDFIRRYI